MPEALVASLSSCPVMPRDPARSGLLFVELLGAVGGGSQRWLDLGFIRLQPSEFMKPAVVMALAHFYAACCRRGDLRRWSALWPALVLIGLRRFAALVMLQPDLGTAIADRRAEESPSCSSPDCRFGSSSAQGARRRLAALADISFSMLHEYQRNRVLIFLNPESRSARRRLSHHPVEDRDRFGRRVRKGLPQRHPKPPRISPRGPYRLRLCHHGGGMGAARRLLLIGGFVLLLFRWGWRVAAGIRRAASEGSPRAGLTMTIFFYVAINLMMVMGLAPVVGIPLPWLSLRRLVDADGDDLHRPDHGDRPQSKRQPRTIRFRNLSREQALPFRASTQHASGPLSAESSDQHGRSTGRTHSSVGRAADS